ncbi:hypothetical protein M1328_05205 [Patescibacteria group bacterium]|nr:hypothetical protein [Patescibacteria group bacterium]
MKKIFFISILIFLSAFILLRPVKAADELIFDTTNHYLGGCQLTNKSEFELKENLSVSTFQLWYNWNQDETSLPVAVTFNGEKFANFDAKRSACDPYQHQWCNADYSINRVFRKGKYSVEIPNNRMCLKPNETGTVRLYGSKDTVSSFPPTGAITNPPGNKEQPTITAARIPGCSCKQSTIILSAVVTSIATSALVALLLRR